MAEIGDLVPIDDNNTARWPEGMPPSDVNDAGRADEGIMSRWHRDTNGSLVSTGTSTAYNLTTNQSLTAYYDGLEIAFTSHVACGDNPTLQLGALTAAAMQAADGTALQAGDIPIDTVVNFISRDNASTPTWRLMSPPIATSVVVTTEGDLVVGDSSGNPARLPIGTAGQALLSDGTTALWSSVFVPNQIAGLEISNNSTLPNTDIDVSAGSAADDADSVTIDLQTAITKKLNATWQEGDNQGGLDTGTVAADTIYDIYAISKDDGIPGDVIFTTKGSSPTLPTGFTKKRFIGRIPTGTGGNIIANQITQQRIDGQYYNATLDTSSGSQADALAMPDGPKDIDFSFNEVSSSAGANFELQMGGDSGIDATSTYKGVCTNFAATVNFTTSIVLANGVGAGVLLEGAPRLMSSDSQGQIYSLSIALGASNTGVTYLGAGSKDLSTQALSRLRFFPSAGAFNNGQIYVAGFKEGAYAP